MNTQGSRRSDDEIIRSMIEKENDYINQRMGWFATLQGLLIAALSFAAKDPQGERFFAILCILGFFVGFIILFPITAAHLTMNRLLKWWEAHKPEGYDGPDVIGMGPPKPKWISERVGPWTFLVLVFLLAWIAIGFHPVWHLIRSLYHSLFY
jgi:hypothetical protein